MQDKLELFPPAFFQAVKDDDIELRPAFRIVEGAKAVKHLRTKEAHGRSFRTTCLEVLVCVGKVGTRRANSILANVPIGAYSCWSVAALCLLLELARLLA